MKKLLALLLTAVLAVGCVAFTGCSETVKEYTGIKKVENYADMKVGFITLHDESSTYDKNFIDSAKEVCQKLGITKYEIKTNVPEGKECYTAAKKFAEQGYNLVFADSFGHEKYLLQAAKEYPDTQFCHATGTKAHTERRGNHHNAFASIYEGRYLAGVAAGLKLKAMMEADSTIVPKVGYVGAFPYAEVKSGYTSWFLGLRSIVPTATMEVKFTSSWYDYDKEKATAEALIQDKCVLISQHADSMGAPEACMNAGVPNVSYNVDTRTMTKDEKINNSYIIASKVNWGPYFEYMLSCLQKGTEIAYDWTGTIETGSVQLLALNEKAAAPGTQKVLDDITAQFKAGTLKVFDTSKFNVTKNDKKNTNATVDAAGKLLGYKADVDDMGDYVADTEVVKTAGEVTYFAESEFRSAPYFDIDIDGIEIK